MDRLTLTPPQPQPVMPTQQTIMKRTRPFDEVNGSDGKFHKSNSYQSLLGRRKIPSHSILNFVSVYRLLLGCGLG